MDYLTLIEDPRHTPGKRHGYAKEQPSSSSPQTFSNTNQKSLFTNFITTPPVAKPQGYFPIAGYVTDASKFYYGKTSQATLCCRQKPELDSKSAPVLYPSEKSAFTKYKNSPCEQSTVYNDPLPITESLIPDGDILKPEPRYAAPVISGTNNSTITLRSAQYSTNSDGSVTQIMGVDIVRGQNGTPQQAMPTSRSESGYRGSPSSPPKHLEDQPRLKNFQDILNSFQMASDRALRQQRERYRYATSGYESDQGLYTENSGRSSGVAYSEHDYRLKKNKHQHLRALTISIPAVGRNVHQDTPTRWCMEVNGTYVDVESSSPTISAVTSVPPSPPLASSQASPNGSAFSKDYGQVTKRQRIFGGDSFERDGAVRERRYARSVSRSRLISDIEAQTVPFEPSPVPHSYLVRCSSTESRRKPRMISSTRASSRSPQLPPSEPRSPSSEREDDDSASVIGLYKQMTGNHLELLEYASAHLGKFFRNRDLIVSKTSLHRLKLNDLIFESLAPAFSKCSTHFFDAFLPHSGFLSTAISLMAEPVPRHYSGAVKLSFSDGNIWNPPTLVEIKAHRDEEQQILQRLPRHRSTSKYRFLAIPRYSFSTINSFAADHLNVDVDESYERQLCFILMQLVCALKSLQLNGIETVSNDFSEFILLHRYARTDLDAASVDQLPRILLLQESLRTRSKKPAVGLCEYGLGALSAMLNLNNCDLPTDSAFPARTSFSYSLMECAKALQQDKSSSLTDAKNALEFGMFVGQDASLFKSEEDTQAWIDSQRADYVNYLFREVIDGSCKLNEVYEQLRLQFLLSATPQTLLKSLQNMRS